MDLLFRARKVASRIHDKKTRFLDAFWNGYWPQTYAQLSEDRIISLFLNGIGIPQPRYLEIGAYHPKRLSNTYLLYLQGGSGVCIEPDPELFARFPRARPRDLCLNVGIGVDEKRQADFYVMDPPTLNTFSKEDAQRYREAGHRIREVVRSELVPINEIISRHFRSWPNLISMDVEGLELQILRSMDLERYRPELFCVETLIYPTMEKNRDIIDYLTARGYSVFADTVVNTIFVRSDRLPDFTRKKG